MGNGGAAACLQPLLAPKSAGKILVLRHQMHLERRVDSISLVQLRAGDVAARYGAEGSGPSLYITDPR